MLLALWWKGMWMGRRAMPASNQSKALLLIMTRCFTRLMKAVRKRVVLVNIVVVGSAVVALFLLGMS